MQKFNDFCIATGMRPESARKYCERMRLFQEHFGNLSEIAPEDCNKVFAKFESNGFREATKNVYKITIRKYFKSKGSIPEYIKPYLRIREYHIVRPLKTMLNDEEMNEVMSLCRNLAEKTFIGIMMETGCRIGELLIARTEDVAFDDMGALIIVDFKKTLRRIRIIRSASLLKEYISNRQARDKLFDFTYDQIRNVFRCRINKRLHKHLSPHMFRKMAATRLAPHMTEYQLCQAMGWVIGSKSARHYVFMSGRDVDPVLAKMNRNSWT